mgnify:CR=1 FL=1
MDNNVTDKLQNLKAVLHKVMGPDSITCIKYTNALEDAIDFIYNDKLSITTPVFRLTAEKTPIGGIIIDLYTTNDDEHLQTIEFDPEDIINDTIHGET